jgi:hypothetical protein
LADVSDEEVTVFISEELAPSSFHWRAILISIDDEGVRWPPLANEGMANEPLMWDT